MKKILIIIPAALFLLFLFFVFPEKTFAGYCGLFGCEADEDCNVCPSDCGVCPSPPPALCPLGDVCSNWSGNCGACVNNLRFCDGLTCLTRQPCQVMESCVGPSDTSCDCSGSPPGSPCGTNWTSVGCPGCPVSNCCIGVLAGCPECHYCATPVCIPGQTGNPCTDSNGCPGTYTCDANRNWFCNAPACGVTPPPGACDDACGLCGYRLGDGTCTSDSNCCSPPPPTPPPPTPTSPPLQKSCTVTLSSPSVYYPGMMTATVQGNANMWGDGNVRLWVERQNGGQISPAPGVEYLYAGTYYYYLTECISTNNATCSTSSNLTLPVGDYHFHCDVPPDPNKCSGNPFCTYEGGPVVCSGWVSCSNSDHQPFSVLASKGSLLGRIWNDTNLNLSADDGDPYFIQNPAGTCGAYSNLSTFVAYTGPETGTRLPNQCNPQPYWAATVVPGLYNVWSSVLPGWQSMGWACTSWTPTGGFNTGTNCPGGLPSASGVGNTATGVRSSSGQAAHVWFGMTPIPPICSITGPTTLTVGLPHTWSATAMVGGTGGDANVAIERNNIASVPGVFMSYSDCGDTNSSCTTTATWTPGPGDLGDYYIFCRGWHDALRECRSFGPYNYPQNTDCSTPQNPDACPDTDCIEISVVPPGAWFQVENGDVQNGYQLVHSLSSAIPITVPPGQRYFVLGNSGAVVSTGDDIPDFGNGTVAAPPLWVRGYSYDQYPAERYDYAYFDQRITNPTPLVNNPNPAQLPNPAPGVPGFWKVTGDLTLPSATWNISGGDRIVILVDGNLNINGKIFINNPYQGNFLAIIVSGNIIISPNVYIVDDIINPAVTGVFIANGTISTGTNGAGTDTPLVASGVFAAHGGFVLQRGNENHPTSSVTVPAEKFIYDPTLVMQSPLEIAPPEFIWEEVAP